MFQLSGPWHPGARGTSVRRRRRRVMPHRKARESKEPSRCSRHAHTDIATCAMHTHVREHIRRRKSERDKGVPGKRREKERGWLVNSVICVWCGNAMRELKKERTLREDAWLNAKGRDSPCSRRWNDWREGIARSGVGAARVRGGRPAGRPAASSQYPRSDRVVYYAKVAAFPRSSVRVRYSGSGFKHARAYTHTYCCKCRLRNSVISTYTHIRQSRHYVPAIRQTRVYTCSSWRHKRKRNAAADCFAKRQTRARERSVKEEIQLLRRGLEGFSYSRVNGFYLLSTKVQSS